MDEIFQGGILRGPIGPDDGPPDLEEVGVLRPADKAVLDPPVRAPEGVTALIDKEIGLPEPFGEGRIQEAGGVHPQAAVAVQEFHPADVGKMRRLHLPFLPFPDHVLGKVDPVEQRPLVQDDEFGAGKSADAVQAGPYQGRRLLLTLQPERENAAGLRVVRLVLRNVADRRGIGPQIVHARPAIGAPAHPPAVQPGKPERIEQVAEKGHADVVPETSHQIRFRYAKIRDFA